jgi:TPR repeat protein
MEKTSQKRSLIDQIFSLSTADFDERLKKMPSWLLVDIAEAFGTPDPDDEEVGPNIWLCLLKLYTEAAKRNDVRAMVTLGQMVPPNDHEHDSSKWLFKAVKFGYTPAMTALGDYYYEQGLYDEAINWYNKAVANGDDELAYIRLANCYEEGNGVDCIIDEARRLYKMAIDKFGNAEAMFRLACTYIKDESMPIDERKNIIRDLLKASSAKGYRPATEASIVYYGANKQ